MNSDVSDGRLSGDDECPVHVGVDVALEVVLTRLEGADRRLDGLATVAGRTKGQLLAALLRIDADVVGRAVVVHEGDREVLAGGRLDGGDVEREVRSADLDRAIGDRCGVATGVTTGRCRGLA